MPKNRNNHRQSLRRAARWRAFAEAREFVWTLGLHSPGEWRAYCRGERLHRGTRPADVPASPGTAYKGKGWVSWADWLGTAVPDAPDGRTYLPFPAAREIARSLGLATETDWLQHCRKAVSGSLPALPPGMPLAPERVYHGLGWRGWRDWLAAPASPTGNQRIRSYADARRFVRSLCLKTSTEWRKYCRHEMPGREPLPADIPTAPDRAYRGNGWMTWGDWLGTGADKALNRLARPFQEARRFVRRLGLKNMREWRLYCAGKMKHLGRRPDGIPRWPRAAYRKDGWAGWGDWLGTGTVASFLREYRFFSDAREFARGLGLKGEKEWLRHCKTGLPGLPAIPPDIPRSPDRVYRGKGWMSWGDWLGTGRVASQLRTFRPFSEGRLFARALGLTSIAEWRRYCKGEMPALPPKPVDIPHAANDIYKDEGWLSWGDWLGTDFIAPSARHYRPFKQARAFARSLGLTTQPEWKAFCRGRLPSKGALPNDIPRSPWVNYADSGWTCIGDWLGTGKPPRRTGISRDFKAARAFARRLRIRSSSEWQQYCRGRLPHLGTPPADIPHNPDTVYCGKGWVSWGDWLGTGYVANQAREYRTFEQARTFARGLKLKSRTEWEAYRRGDMPSKGRLPADVPSNADLVYREDGWLGWGDWLGTNARQAPQSATRRHPRSRTPSV